MKEQGDHFSCTGIRKCLTKVHHGVTDRFNGVVLLPSMLKSHGISDLLELCETAHSTIRTSEIENQWQSTDPIP